MDPDRDTPRVRREVNPGGREAAGFHVETGSGMHVHSGQPPNLATLHSIGAGLQGDAAPCMHHMPRQRAILPAPRGTLR